IWRRAGSAEALSMAQKTLSKMAAGGIYDHLGGGFHRYSTDRKWFLPHFEKMLYDQALLSRAYAEAYQATRDPGFAATARGVFDYVLREMTSPEGGFYSAQDADSLDPEDPREKKEGAFFVWKVSELKSLLDPKNFEVFCRAYGVEKEGNVAQDPFHEFTGKNVLFAAGDPKETQGLDRARKVLFEARKKRPPVHLDDKVLTDWNGLMIASFAHASQVLEEPKYLEAARRASDFVVKKLWSPEKGLLHRYRDGESAIAGTLSDYAFYIYALLELYQADLDPKDLELAKTLTDRMIADFWDEKAGGFFMTAQSAEKLITRPKEDHDGAVPSGNSLGAMDLLILYRITGEPRYENYASKTLAFFSTALQAQPSGLSQMLAAVDLALGPSVEITVTKAKGDEAGATALLREVHSRFLPNKVVKFAEAGSGAQKSSVSVCRDFVCELPVTDVEALRKLLTKG
ncbi:MAG TPA: thioredoxin domain-containing protein, partial [Candidatus Omnitrophota bacterium]|nr:thioredoxin domain-containing protein [Candidatus Omnitrophota bacterium]